MANSSFRKQGSVLRSLFLFLAILSVAGCASVRYRYAIDDSSLPTANVSLEGVYSDDFLAASVAEIKHGESLLGFRLRLENRSDVPLSVAFDRARFEAREKKEAFMRGISEPCRTLELPAGKTLEEPLYPASSLRRVTDRHGRFLQWEFKPLIDWWDESWDLAKLGIHLPVRVGESQRDYSFFIRVKRE